MKSHTVLVIAVIFVAANGYFAYGANEGNKHIRRLYRCVVYINIYITYIHWFREELDTLFYTI